MKLLWGVLGLWPALIGDLLNSVCFVHSICLSFSFSPSTHQTLSHYICLFLEKHLREFLEAIFVSVINWGVVYSLVSFKQFSSLPRWHIHWCQNYAGSCHWQTGLFSVIAGWVLDAAWCASCGKCASACPFCSLGRCRCHCKWVVPCCIRIRGMALERISLADLSAVSWLAYSAEVLLEHLCLKLHLSLIFLFHSFFPPSFPSDSSSSSFFLLSISSSIFHLVFFFFLALYCPEFATTSLSICVFDKRQRTHFRAK